MLDRPSPSHEVESAKPESNLEKILKTAERRAGFTRRYLEEIAGKSIDDFVEKLGKVGIEANPSDDRSLTEAVYKLQKKLGLPDNMGGNGCDGMYGPFTRNKFERFLIIGKSPEQPDTSSDEKPRTRVSSSGVDSGTTTERAVESPAKIEEDPSGMLTDLKRDCAKMITYGNQVRERLKYMSTKELQKVTDTVMHSVTYAISKAVITIKEYEKVSGKKDVNGRSRIKEGIKYFTAGYYELRIKYTKEDFAPFERAFAPGIQRLELCESVLDGREPFSKLRQDHARHFSESREYIL